MRLVFQRLDDEESLLKLSLYSLERKRLTNDLIVICRILKENNNSQR